MRKRSTNTESTSSDKVDYRGARKPPFVEHGAYNGSLAATEVKAINTGRIVVRVTSFSTRLVDEDNLCEKFHVDSCRYAGLLHSDAPDQTHIIVTQKKVQTKKEEKTKIEIIQ